MSRHSKGPWTCAFAAHGHAMIDTLAFADKPCSDGGPDKMGPLPIKPTRENACLIAAAPELLAACKALWRIIKTGESGPDGFTVVHPPRRSGV